MFQIFPALSVCLLLYLPTILSQPINEVPTDNLLQSHITKNDEPYPDRLDLITAGEIEQGKNEDINILIEKVREVTSRYKKDVDGTIAEVQKILEKDYSLPKLTRGEIVEILDNLTKADLETLRKEGLQSRKGYQKALMLVMPYTSKDTKLSVEELYTKPPITHIVGSHIIKLTTPKKNVEIITTPIPPSSTSDFLPTLPPDELSTSTISVEISTPGESTSRPPQRRPQRIRTTKPPQELRPMNVEITTTKPKKQFHIYKASTKPDYVISTHRPIYSKPTRLYNNHKYPETPQPFQPNKGINIINSPSLVTKSPEKSWLHNQQVYKKPSANRLAPVQSSVYKAPLASSTIRTRYRPTPQTTTTTQMPIANLPDSIPDSMKDFVKEIQLAEPASSAKNKFSSQYVAAETQFQQPSTENIVDILGAIGNTPTTKMPDLSNVADNLTPDMKELLMTFGLIDDPNKPKEPEMPPVVEEQPQPEKIDIKPISYTEFKPLPDSAPTNDEMYDLLSSYGLIGGSRSAKNIKEHKTPKHLKEVPDIDLEMIPESMHGILEDIGLTEPKRRGKRIGETGPENSNIFNPSESNVSKQDLAKLNQLMETLVKLEKLNRTVTEADFQEADLANIAEISKLLGHIENTDKVVALGSGPSPVIDDFGLDKNEVKREELTTVTPEELKDEITTSTTEESKFPSIDALSESFGGPANTKDEDATLPPPAPPRKTGAYYLVDWNTFLEVGEEGKNRVNIRFSPRAGDPSRFIKVTVS